MEQGNVNVTEAFVKLPPASRLENPVNAAGVHIEHAG
jgi:hypothetical protein